MDKLLCDLKLKDIMKLGNLKKISSKSDYQDSDLNQNLDRYAFAENQL